MFANPAYLLLQDSNYLRLWLIGAITATLRWLEVLGIGIYTLEVTGSPLYVALMLFCRTLPGVFFGTFTAMLATRYNRKYLLASGLMLLVLNAGVLSALTLTGSLQLWHIAAGAVLSGVIWTLEHPVRRTLLGDVAGLDRLKNAVSLDQVTFNMTRALGPLLGGGVYLMMGLSGVYIVSALAFSVAVVLVHGINVVVPELPRGQNSFWFNFSQGFRYTISKPILRAVMLITLIENFFGFSYATLVPVIGAKSLALDAGGIGILQSMEGIGATVGAVLLAISARNFNLGRMFSSGAVLFLVGVLIFAVAGSFALACFGLLLAGPGLAAFGAMQSTILLRHSDPEQRVKVMGVLVVCIGAGPIGVICVGLLANLVGPVTALTIMCVAGLLSLGLVLANSRQLLRESAG